MPRNSDNIYLSLNLFGGSDFKKTKAVTDRKYTSPILEKASDYEFCVESFEIPMSGVPLMEFSPLANSIIGVCEYVPSEFSDLSPAFGSPFVYYPSNATIRETDIDYYYVYSLSHIVDMLSKALALAWAAAGSPGGAGATPYVSFDPNTELISFVLPPAFYNAPTATPNATKWTCFMNLRLESIMPSFFIHKRIDPAYPGGRCDLDLVQVPYNHSFIPELPAYPTGTIIIRQEYSTVDYISSSRSLVIMAEGLSATSQYFPNNNENSNETTTLPIIDSFFLHLDKIGSSRSTAIYNSDNYKWQSLNNDNDIRNISMSIHWVNKVNTMSPLLIGRNDTANIKLVFRKKVIN